MEVFDKNVVVYTVEDVSKIIKMSPDAVRKYIKQGDLKANKPKKRFLIYPEDLKTFIESKKGF